MLKATLYWWTLLYTDERYLNATLHWWTLRYTVECYVIMLNATLYWWALRYTVERYFILLNATLYCWTLRYTVERYFIPLNVTLYCWTLLYIDILFYFRVASDDCCNERGGLDEKATMKDWETEQLLRASFIVVNSYNGWTTTYEQL